MIKKNFYLSYIEDDELKEKCEKIGMCESELLRSLIKGYYPKEKPDKKFYDEIENLRAIGRNINQIAKYANATSVIKESNLLECLNKLDDFIYRIEKKYLINEKYDIKIKKINDD